MICPECGKKIPDVQICPFCNENTEFAVRNDYLPSADLKEAKRMPELQTDKKAKKSRYILNKLVLLVCIIISAACIVWGCVNRIRLREAQQNYDQLLTQYELMLQENIAD